mgnify:CR=1 FL=1
MVNVLVFYYSRTGNTEKMVMAVANGIRETGEIKVDAEYKDASELSNYDAVIIGTPTYHHDTVLEIKSLFENAAVKNVSLKGKVGAAFGSYGWSGEGYWTRKQRGLENIKVVKKEVEGYFSETVLLFPGIIDGSSNVVLAK